MLAVRSRRDARHAGPSPKSTAVAIAMPTVKSSTRRSNPTRPRPTRVRPPSGPPRGNTMRRSGASDAPAEIAAYATARPMSVPAIASTRLSVISCRTIRRRLAPSASRIATSRSRPSPRTSIRFARLTHTISSTDATAAPRSSTERRIRGSTRWSSSGTAVAPHRPLLSPPSGSGSCSLMRWPIAMASAVHCFDGRLGLPARDDLVRVIPGFAEIGRRQRRDGHAQFGFSGQPAEPWPGHADDCVQRHR